MDATVEDMLEDYWLHTFMDDPKAMEEVEDPDFDPDSVAQELASLKAQKAPEPALPDDFEPMT